MLTLAATAFLAAAPQVRLAYASAGTTCPPREALVSAVRTRLGADPFVEQAGDVIEVEIKSTGRGLAARVVRRHDGAETGRRELASPTADCSELFKALELAVAIGIDPRAGLAVPAPAPPPPQQPPPPPTESPPAPSAPAVVAPPPPPEPSTPLYFRAGVAPLGAVGTGPGPTGGFAVLAGLRRGWLVVDLGGRVELPVSLALDPGRVTTQALVGKLAGCIAVSVVRACLRGSLGGLRVSSDGLSRATQQTLFFATVGARVALEWQLARLFILRPYLDIDAHLARTTLIADGQPVWNMPPLLGVLGVAALLTTGG